MTKLFFRGLLVAPGLLVAKSSHLAWCRLIDDSVDQISASLFTTEAR
jgi:hypothetical protein